MNHHGGILLRSTTLITLPGGRWGEVRELLPGLHDPHDTRLNDVPAVLVRLLHRIPLLPNNKYF
jgi:hypothetical protein